MGKFKVGITRWAPSTYPCSNEPPSLKPTAFCPNPGHANQILAYILGLASIDYEVLGEPENIDWGGPKYVDEADPRFCEGWSGVLGEIQNGTLDTITAPYVINARRLKCFTFTYPIAATSSVIVFKDTVSVSDNLMALYAVYSGEIWMLALLTILLATACLTVNARVFAFEETEQKRSTISHAVESFWMVIEFISDQCSTIPSTFAQKTNTARWLLSFIGIFALFFLRLYEGGLLTQLLVSRKVVPFRSTSELAEAVREGRAEYVIIRGTYFEDYLEDESLTAMDTLRDALRTTDVVRMDTTAEALQYLRKRPAGTVGLHAVAESLRGAVLGCDERMVLDRDLPATRGGFIMNKNATGLRNRLSSAIYRSLSHTSFLDRKYGMTGVSDDNKKDCTAESQHLGLGNFVGVFLLSSVVMTLALWAFCFEVAALKLKHAWKTWAESRSSSVVGQNFYYREPQQIKSNGRTPLHVVTLE